MKIERQDHRLTWPRPEHSDQVACKFCDTLQTAPPIKEGEAAHCAYCHGMLFQNRRRSLARATAYSTAALILMIVVHTFPFLSVKAAGTRTELTLWHASMTLFEENSHILGMAVIFFTIISPLGLAFSLLYIAAPLRHGRALPGTTWVARWLEFFQPWSMLEVFLLGLVISLMKLGEIAEVHFGIGLWGLSGLVLCLAAALSGIDRRELWDRLELAQKHS
ncbi:paraquat-inducible protein A [Haloferula sp.]|uniref:paraquat-inducible protein A n=1 Tax=Haloferula sp. TaxID=2497595 RepID=UPI00329F1401